MATLFRSGVLVLPYLPRSSFLQKIIAEAAKCVNKTLYIDLLTTSKTQPVALPTDVISWGNVINTKTFYEFMTEVYNNAANLCGSIDVRVLLPSIGCHGLPRSTVHPIELCIGNTSSIRNLIEFEHIVSSRYTFHDGRFHLKFVHAADELKAQIELKSKGHQQEGDFMVNDDFKTYPGVVIGGTFDRIHDGHKLLIGTAALLAEKKLTVGVAEGPLLHGKVLEELIEPVGLRIRNVEELIDDMKPGLEKKVVAITDPAGPSGTDDDLQLLVLSQETIQGGPYVNGIRKENNLGPLELQAINMLDSDNSDLATGLQSNKKLSSSGKRIRELGLLRREPNLLKTNKPYVIGLTGGIATGKSAVTRRLQKLGASAINCDKLGHQAYLPGSNAYYKLIEEFGDSIVSEDSTVNRRALGSIVFSDRKKLDRLNEIVWPEIANMVEEKLRKISDDNIKICVIEAAVLLEAGWDQLVNEIWVTSIPVDEAVKRITERDGFNETQARIRIESQMKSSERIDKSHVVISTLWEPEFTQKIVEKAWEGVLKRAESSSKRSSYL